MKKYTLEIDLDDGALPDLDGLDVEYTLLHHLGEFLNEAGYLRARLVLHAGRNTTRFAVDRTGTITKRTND